MSVRGMMCFCAQENIVYGNTTCQNKRAVSLALWNIPRQRVWGNPRCIVNREVRAGSLAGFVPKHILEHGSDKRSG